MFDEDPDNSYEHYKCDNCGGTITLNRNTKEWECDHCDFTAKDTQHKNKKGE